MGLWGWISNHWFTLLQSVGITGGLVFTALAFRRNATTERIHLLFELKEHHAAIWRELFSEPQLARVLDPDADPDTAPVTTREDVFLGLLILHLACAFESVQAELLSASGFEEDIREFFALPLPRAVWEKRKRFQDSAFARFVDATIADQSLNLEDAEVASGADPDPS